MCSIRDKVPKKSLHAVQLMLFKELEHQNIEKMVKEILKLFLIFSINKGFTDIKDLLENLDFIYKIFYHEEFYEDKITEKEALPIKHKRRKCNYFNVK
jgi:hypothetical protein